jgi:hypothetical protein
MEILRQRRRIIVMAAPSSGQQAPTQSLETPLPDATTLLHAARFAQQLDCPIQMDYYADSCIKKAYIGEDPETKDRILMKNMNEYTSLISKIMRASDNYIIQTENSLYIVSGKIEKRKVPASQLLGSD